MPVESCLGVVEDVFSGEVVDVQPVGVIPPERIFKDVPRAAGNTDLDIRGFAEICHRLADFRMVSVELVESVDEEAEAEGQMLQPLYRRQGVLEFSQAPLRWIRGNVAIPSLWTENRNKGRDLSHDLEE